MGIVITRRTIIGNIVGGAVMAVGIVALVTALGIQESSVDEAVVTGGSTVYQFDAPRGTQGSLSVTGDSFDVSVLTPGGEDSTTSYRDGADVRWMLEDDGTFRVEVQNTGGDELFVEGTIRYNTNPILYTYHAMVIVAGIVIIGFSAGFSMRKPRGF